ncbi:MAG TPA: CBS domain-containing protein [Chloroflexi bacterium]|nr:CBS domain-containing protein [Chloroflexota bacterium]
MLVREHMTSPAVTITADTPFQDALNMMRERKFRRLPVVDKKGKLVGIVSERDLLYASPSPATSLSVWEMNYLLSQLEIKSLMTKAVITILPDTTIESAASVMMKKKIGGLPVVDDNNKVIGVITETDIFKILTQMFGGGEAGLRLTLEVVREKGILATLAQAILDLGGYIVSVGSYALEDKPDMDGLVVKVQGVNKEQLIDTLEALGDHVVDARDCKRIF